MKSEKGKKKKRHVHYSVLFVPNVTTEKVKQITLSHKVLKRTFIALIVILGIISAYVYYVSDSIAVANSSIKVLKEQVVSLNDQKTSLESENKELSDKLSFMSDTIQSQKQTLDTQNEEIAEQYKPTSFPLDGTATYSEDETTDEEQHPIIVFHVAEGMHIIAAGAGTVTEVASDDQYGYKVKVDHGEGYVSIYRNASTPQVKEGDKVTHETTLFTVQAGADTFGYQIMFKEEYEQPLDLLEIYG